jgi:hypothetical protein
MIRAICTVTLAFVLAACATSGSSQADQLAALRVQMAAHSAAIDDADKEALQLTAAWSDVADNYDRARIRYARARAQFDEATSRGESAGSTFSEARTEFDSATSMWRFYRELVVVAAALDAANLEASRAAGTGSERVDCQPMSTQQYRRVLERRGVNLAGKDIDHIVPHALGGADDVSNYQILDQSLNRSLGAAWGTEKCSIAGLEQCALAVAISRRCGEFTGPMPW